MLQAVLQSDFD